MKSRHRAREIALQILYQYDLTWHSSQKAAPQGQELTSNLLYHFNHFNVSEDLRPFAAQLVAGTLREMTHLDALLEKHASNWKVARMSSVDRSLLRMAIFELVHVIDTPHSVVIDEAIELGKQFGTSETPGFINGILDSIRIQIPTQGNPA